MKYRTLAKIDSAINITEHSGKFILITLEMVVVDKEMTVYSCCNAFSYLV